MSRLNLSYEGQGNVLCGGGDSRGLGRKQHVVILSSSKFTNYIAQNDSK